MGGFSILANLVSLQQSSPPFGFYLLPLFSLEKILMKLILHYTGPFLWGLPPTLEVAISMSAIVHLLSLRCLA